MRYNLCNTCGVSIMYADDSALTPAEIAVVDAFVTRVGTLAYVGSLSFPGDTDCDCCGAPLLGEDGHRAETV